MPLSHPPRPAATDSLPTPVQRVGAFLFRWRNWIFPCGLAALLGVLRPVPLFNSPRLDPWLDALGLLVALGGEALRVTVLGRVRIERAGRRGAIFAGRLVTDGVFGQVRNPLYLG